VVHGDGGDAYAHLAGAGLGRGQLFEGEHLGAAVAAQRHRFH
jgi:hypothetical protein